MPPSPAMLPTLAEPPFAFPPFEPALLFEPPALVELALPAPLLDAPADPLPWPLVGLLPPPPRAGLDAPLPLPPNSDSGPFPLPEPFRVPAAEASL